MAGHYVRIAPRGDRPLSDQEVEIKNRAGLRIAADALIGLEFLALVRFGLRRADAPGIRDSLAVAEHVLGADLPTGRTYYRYNGDGYGEHEDGAPFDGTGRGRPWPLLAGERGHFAAAIGEDRRPYLAAMARMSGPGGLIPEQVWDAAPIPELGLATGGPSGSAMPLVWAHSEFLKLATLGPDGVAVERVASVAKRYLGRSASRGPVHWRDEVPATDTPAGTRLIVEALTPFILVHSFDGWATPQEAVAAEGAFGLWSVSIDGRPAGTALRFTRRFDARWEGRDHVVRWL